MSAWSPSLVEGTFVLPPTLSNRVRNDCAIYRPQAVAYTAATIKTPCSLPARMQRVRFSSTLAHTACGTYCLGSSNYNACHRDRSRSTDDKRMTCTKFARKILQIRIIFSCCSPLLVTRALLNFRSSYRETEPNCFSMTALYRTSRFSVPSAHFCSSPFDLSLDDRQMTKCCLL
jgi:hypothetical protein